MTKAETLEGFKNGCFSVSQAGVLGFPFVENASDSRV